MLRPRGSSHNRDPLVPASPLLPQYASATSSPPSRTRLHLWKRLMLVGCVLYSSFLLVWFVYIDKTHENDAKPLENFISAADMDEAKWNYLHAHEDVELRSEIPFAELEMEFLHQNNSWDFAVFPQKAREAVRKAQDLVLPNITPNRDPQERDGIVMVVYPKLLASAYATIRALREVLHCQLPIELWYRSQEMKFFPEAYAQLQEWSRKNNGNITFREIGEPGVVGFATKVFAIYHSFFERVLFLDADNVPVRDPTFLFGSPEFKWTGAVFWPDFWHPSKTIFNIQPHSLIWELLDLPSMRMFEQESGQLLVDRRRHAVPLELVKFYMSHQLVKFYMSHRPNHFDKMKLAHGDKDLFRFAWLKLGASFHMIESPPAVAGKVVNDSFCGMTMVQHDAQGDVLFLHRNSHKLMGTPRRKAINMKAAAIRRARNKRLRMKMSEADRITRDEADRITRDGIPEVTETPSPTLDAPEPDGYPDMAIWTHMMSLKNTSSRSNYRIKTYEAYPDFEKGQNCYGMRYLNQSQHFVTHEFANLSYADLETELRRFAMEGARFYEQAGIMGR
ncbi:hypothetical protein PHMEG_00012876 [Phytophthora megakarya]|uniref:Uncharacterized protein n=1 Tax=Phytophthora megakarya TaxID=4795 RepID=A0A225W852_9STRA|nr:hypothetical protein PHMEG_00012876 [Phytophthora megakarya]